MENCVFFDCMNSNILMFVISGGSVCSVLVAIQRNAASWVQPLSSLLVDGIFP